MTRILLIGLLVAISLLQPVSTTNAQQASCPEGRTASGQCVNSNMARSMRLDGMIFSQPKISETAFPVLPSDDFTYRYPFNLIFNQFHPSATGRPRAPSGPVLQ